MSGLPYPVLTMVPDFNKPPQCDISATADRTQLGTGEGYVTFPQPVPTFGFGVTFTLLDGSECDDMEEFFRGRGGRTHPFYWPSWRRDLLRGAGAAGSHYLTTTVLNFAAEHLTNPATRADHYGRQIFVWQPGEDLHVDRIVSSSENEGLTYLDLELPLPFTVDSARAVVGFLHLARFSEDELKWQYAAVDVATVETRIMSVRQYLDDPEETLPISEIQFYAQRGFTSAVSDAEECSPVSNRFATALGPEVIDTPQGGAYVKSWVVWEEAGQLRIKAGASITYPDTGGTVCSLSGGDVGTHRLTITFDKNEHLLVGLEFPGVVQLRSFGGTLEFAGKSPLLVNNKLIDPAISDADSDVICYYIRPGDAKLYARFERDLFAVERVVAKIPFIPLELKRSTYSAGVHTLELLDVSFRRVRMVSPDFTA